MNPPLHGSYPTGIYKRGQVKKESVKSYSVASSKTHGTFWMSSTQRLEPIVRHKEKSAKTTRGGERGQRVKASTTDLDSGYMFREGKPEEFFYLDHRTVDVKYNLITDVFHDSVPYLSRLEVRLNRLSKSGKKLYRKPP